MKKSCSKIALLVTTLIGFTGATHAAPITYDFTASDFTAIMGGAIPFNTISGSYTLDDTTITQINLTIGSYSYAVSDVAYDSISGMLGGTLNGPSINAALSNDFALATTGDFYFGYSMDGVFDAYYTVNGAVTPAVPVPAAAWLFGSGLIGLAGVARKRKAA